MINLTEVRQRRSKADGKALFARVCGRGLAGKKFAPCYVLLGLGVIENLSAQVIYPGKPVRMLVGYAPGGSTDILARVLASKLAESLQQQVLVDNRSGANGNIAAELVAKSAPDGYTVLMAAAGHTINPSLYKSLPFDPIKDFSAICLVAAVPNILVVHPSIPVKSVRELIALTQGRPGRLTHASSGTGSPGHLSGEVFGMLAKVKFLHVPYKGTGPALIDMIGGQIDLGFPTIPAVLQFVKAGRLRSLGVTSGKRSSSLPDVPTIAESGVSNYEVVGWYGVFGPAGLPKDIVARLNSEIARILKAADTRERLAHEGADPIGNSPGEFAEFLLTDRDKWAKVVKFANIPPAQ